jgi:hypothetical protein
MAVEWSIDFVYIAVLDLIAQSNWNMQIRKGRPMK